MLKTKATNSATFKVYSSIADVDQAVWSEIVADDVYLGIDYLRALESALTDWAFRYIEVHQNNETIGVVYCQIVKITSSEISKEALSKRMGKLPGHLINSLDLSVMISGNAFATGENGFAFKSEISYDKQVHLVADAVEFVHSQEEKRGRKLAVTLIKEFWPEHFEATKSFKQHGCCEVNIDVNMILQLDPQWKTFEDYTAAMVSKFRTKVNRVMDVSQSLDIVDFTEDNLREKEKEVEELYNAIVDKAAFSFGRLNGATLTHIKKALGDRFFFRGYYLQGELIAFATATSLPHALDGNFIGLNYEYNQKYGVYQRILYDFVKHAIDTGASEVRIGRTAEEIKSGIGALPTEMKFYARHRNRVTNALLRPIVQKMRPNSFKLRKPFKAGYYK